MFPLGTVLFPSLVLPLHVFEERYRVMTRRCLDGSGEFGVVLIERGSEVGGRDVRSDVGTVARILEARELPDGRWMLATVGSRRIRVRQWLDDDPHPRADVEDWDDDAPGPDVDVLYTAVRSALRRVLALRSELGDRVPEATIELSEEAGLGSYQASALAPLGPLDRQRLLVAPGPGERLGLLAELLAADEEFLRARLGET